MKKSIINTKPNKTVKSNALLKHMFLPALPARSADSHKGTFGSVAIVGGDTGMLGAILLASRAALFCGAGRVHAFFLAENAPSVDTNHPEIMLHPASALTNMTQLSCIVIGPGLGKSKTAVELLEFCIKQNVSLVIDADALNLISQHPHLGSLLNSRPAETIMTPHPAEAARLLATTVAEIQNNRSGSAQKLATNFRAVCVLKGAGTICAHYDGSWFINTTGNPGLASGGTGDVLSGIIGSLIAQGLTVMQAAKLGVYVHGAAADKLVADGVGPVGLTASEIILEARKQINQLNKLAQY